MSKTSIELQGALNTEDAAAFLGLRPGTLKNWRSKNEGPAYIKIGWTILYPRKRLEQFREKRAVLVIPGEERVA